MLIDDLINKYFEGESTCDEERQLRLFFRQDEIPAHLEEYRAFFAFFDEKIENESTLETKIIPIKIKKSKNRILRYAIVGIAASLILTFGLLGIHYYFDLPKNYVMIDGVCYTQKDIVFQEALNSLQAVSMSEDDILNSFLHD